MTKPTIHRENHWTLEEVREATGGQVLGRFDRRPFAGISTDSRTVRAGELFVALSGERFDGHEFVGRALSQGAAGVIVSLDRLAATAARHTEVPVVGVPDTLRALGDLAGYWRRQHVIPLVAITGSNGKTTTKEMVAVILSRRLRVLKNQGNLNNLVGLPLTLLELTGNHQIAVVEMGMNRLGEIARLTEIACPDLGLITNIQPAHLEGLGSLAGIQTAKGELFAGMSADATIVVNRDDQRVQALAASFAGRQVGFSTTRTDADVVLHRLIAMDAGGSRFLVKLADQFQEVRLAIVGRHHLANAMAAVAVAWTLEIPAQDIAKALAAFRPFDKRMEVLTLSGDIHLINDSYNANPASVKAALQTLMAVKGEGRAVAVLGDMLEMGRESAELHREVGRFAAGEGVDYLLVLGTQTPQLLAGAAEVGMSGGRLTRAENHRELADRLRSLLAAGDWVLVKGSRGMRMEKVVECLLAEPLGDPGFVRGEGNPRGSS
jgi:UDP-N-acetylmuramoyl-tripeptide--D-alanyl-D-alanine ligase